MLFLLKQLSRLTIAFVGIILVTQIVLSLIDRHSADPQNFTQHGLSHITRSFGECLGKIMAMDLQAFRAVDWILWIFMNKPYFIILFIAILVLYYHLRNTMLKEPQVTRQPRLSSKTFETNTKEYTDRKLKELQESEQFKRYKRDKLMGRLRTAKDDEVTAEMEEKQKEIF